jgi:hypothetical protein
MVFQVKQFSAVLVVTSSLSTPLFAQALAEEIVQEYVAEMQEAGLAVALGPKSISGKTVEWRDVVVGMPDGAGSYTMEFIRAEEIGGGQVSMSYPETINMKIDPKGEQPSMDMVIQSTGVTHIISGSKAARDHNIEAETMRITMNTPEPALDMTIDISDIVSNYQNSGDEVTNSKGSVKAASVTMDYKVKDDQNDIVMASTYNNLSGDFDLDYVSEEKMAEMFNGTRNVWMSYTIDSSTTTVDMTTPDAAMLIDGTTSTGSGQFAIQGGILNMTGSGEDANYSVKMKDLPMPPFSTSMDEATFGLQMPMGKSEEPSDARIHMGFEGLKASDTIWGMVDPTGSLPRDKASLNIDLTAKVKWLVDLMKVEEANSMPAEVSSVTINDISLNIAGASFNGVGAATLDNSKFPPEPVGEVNFDLKGGIGLLDKLVALGLVPQQQGQMVKMMSGMFTVPGGDGTDHLKSKIEMKEGGVILANGQRVK